MLELALFLLGLAIGGAVATVLWFRGAARTQAAVAEARSASGAEIASLHARLDEQAGSRDTVERALSAERGTRTELERQVARLETQLAGEREQIEGQRRMLAESQEKLVHVFRSIGSEELSKAQTQLIDTAKREMANQRALSAEELERRRQAIDGSLQPVRELLEKQAIAIAELENKRVAAYASIDTRIEGMISATEAIRSEAGKLSTALRRSDARGRWGEVALRNLVEMAGMTEHVDFETQVHVQGEGAAQRPDLVVRLPGGGSVVVDSKVPLEHYLAALEQPEQRTALLAEHAKALKGHVDALASKAYWNQFDRTPSYVVMFVPIEPALSAALESRRELQEYALRSRVILASSGIFLGLLQTVSLFWRQEQIAENAKRISTVGAELYDRLAKFVQHLEKVGTSLSTAGRSYNDAIGSLESRVLPSARQLRELKATTKDEIATPVAPAIEIRAVVAAELLAGPAPQPAAPQLPEATS